MSVDNRSCVYVPVINDGNLRLVSKQQLLALKKLCIFYYFSRSETNFESSKRLLSYSSCSSVLFTLLLYDCKKIRREYFASASLMIANHKYLYSSTCKTVPQITRQSAFNRTPSTSAIACNILALGNALPTFAARFLRRLLCYTHTLRTNKILSRVSAITDCQISMRETTYTCLNQLA